MARISNPLRCERASGTLGKTIIYSSWRGRPYAKRYAAPAVPNTPGQRAQQARIALGNTLWKSLTADERAAWATVGAPDHLPGYHVFIRHVCRSVIAGQEPSRLPSPADYSSSSGASHPQSSSC
jgi:hypothetical protein